MAPALRNPIKPLRKASTLPHGSESEREDQQASGWPAHRLRHRLGHGHGDAAQRPHLVSQIKHWVTEERKRRHHLSRNRHSQHEDVLVDLHVDNNVDPLDELERILSTHELNDENIEPTEPTRPALIRGKKSSSSRAGLLSQIRSRRKSTAGSSTDARDDELFIPACDVVLDNSRVAQADPNDVHSSTASRSRFLHHDDDIWNEFKMEILKLTHTLRLKRWAKISLNRASEVQVKRLSGALTNAVYVVEPPSHHTSHQQSHRQNIEDNRPKSFVPPPKLLLRIYGPQVEYLIDREKELEILRRLAKQNIGPRMLGTFKNGRFEQFLQSQTLTAEDIRNPETSMQIGKRMKELHVGIDLLDEEREAGANVWSNWNRWTDRAEEVMTWVDDQVRNRDSLGPVFGEDAWKSRGYVCCTEWPTFRQAVEKYRDWLEERLEGSANIADDLVFAHGDTQYGNILRLEPPGNSPLLLPVNTHKRLVVIDFEYAGPNPIGLEFANHFSEWCYDYTSSSRPWGLHVSRFPSREEQRRLITAYVSHDPAFGPLRRFSSTNNIATMPGTWNGSVTSFLLEGRADPSLKKDEYAEHGGELDSTQRVQKLLEDADIWRPANSAHWVTWGIIQANLPEMDESKVHPGKPMLEERGPSRDTMHQSSSHEPVQFLEGPRSETPEQTLDQASLQNIDKKLDSEPSRGDKPDEDEGFDYLGYAQDRALFFWGDLLQLGVVTPNELPADLLKNVKLAVRDSIPTGDRSP